MSGKLPRTYAATVPFPTAVGPARTTSRLLGDAINSRSGLFEARDQRGDLVVAEATDATGLGDADLVHDLARPDPADPGHRLEQCRDLHLPDDVIVLAVSDHLRQRTLSVLQAVLDRCPLTTSDRRLRKGLRSEEHTSELQSLRHLV